MSSMHSNGEKLKENNATFDSVVRFRTFNIFFMYTKYFGFHKCAQYNCSNTPNPQLFCTIFHIRFPSCCTMLYGCFCFFLLFPSFSLILVFCFRRFFIPPPPSFFKTFQVSPISIDSNCSRFLYFFKKCSKSLALKKSTFYKIMHTER